MGYELTLAGPARSGCATWNWPVAGTTMARSATGIETPGITPELLACAPALSGGSFLPAAEENYRADSRGDAAEDRYEYSDLR